MGIINKKEKPKLLLFHIGSDLCNSRFNQIIIVCGLVALSKSIGVSQCATLCTFLSSTKFNPKVLVSYQ